MAKRLTRLFGCLCTAFVAACASSGEPFEEEGARDVQLLVENQRSSTVTAFYQWRHSSPVRLSEIEGGSSHFTQIPVRGQELRVFFRNPGLSPGDPRGPEYAPARGGDAFEWVLRADGTIYYLRIPD